MIDLPAGEWETLARAALRYLGIRPTPARIRDMYQIMALYIIATCIVDGKNTARIIKSTGEAFTAALRIANAEMLVAKVMDVDIDAVEAIR